MTYTVKDNCISCDICQPQCPNGAIKADAQKAGYWIDPTLCDGCPDLEVPLCVQSCEVDALAPLAAQERTLQKYAAACGHLPRFFLNR